MSSAIAALALTLVLQQTPATAPEPQQEPAVADVPPPPAAPTPPPVEATPAVTPTPSDTADQPIVRLFQNLVTDFVRLPSPGSAAILGAGSAVAFSVRPVDDELARWADERGASSYTAIGRIAGDGWTQGGAALSVYVAGLIARHDRTRHLGSDLIRAQALNAVLTRAGKLLVSRARPSGSQDAMPSGHASAAFATAAVVGGHLGWRTGVPAYALAGFIGWTRVRDRVHWATDVVMGATVGTIVGYAVTRGHRERAWTAIPTISRSGMALWLVRTPVSHARGRP